MMGSKAEQWRPEYHFTPSVGWMNDPNGLVYHDGVYHLYYQSGERSRRWDHAVSTDLLTWSEQGTKIPDTPLVEAFSGGAVIDLNNTTNFGAGSLVYLYTGHHDDGTEDQRLAYSTDGGATVHTYDDNPVIESTADNFRDPNAFWYEPEEGWRIVVSRVEKYEDRPAGVEIYSSENLRDWTYESTYRDTNEAGWECPSLLKLPVEGTNETKWIMIVSSMDTCTVEYHVGHFDGTEFTAEDVVRADYGYDFYAAQNWENAPGNRGLIVSWMNNWAYAMEGPDPGWRGAMTVPRTISLHENDGKVEVRQHPAIELTQEREDPIRELTAKPIEPDKNPLDGVEVDSHALDIIMSIKPHSADTVGVEVRKGNDQNSRIIYDSTAEELRFDRTNSGLFFDDNTYGETSMPLTPLEDEMIELRVLVDRCSVEVFANDGRRTMTNLVYADWESTDVSLFSDSGVAELEHMAIYDLTMQ